MSQHEGSPWAEPDQQPNQQPGLDPSQQPPVGARRSNGLGIAGFIVSLIGPCTCGVLSVVGLLMSAIALLRPPRGFAIAGTVVGLLGVLLVGGGLFAINQSFSQFGYTISDIWKLAELQTPASKAATNITQHYSQQNALPANAKGQSLIAGTADPWGHDLRYQRVDQRTFELISLGPDGKYDTSDDVIFTATADAGVEQVEVRGMRQLATPPATQSGGQSGGQSGAGAPSGAGGAP